MLKDLGRKKIENIYFFFAINEHFYLSGMYYNKNKTLLLYQISVLKIIS